MTWEALLRIFVRNSAIHQKPRKTSFDISSLKFFFSILFSSLHAWNKNTKTSTKSEKQTQDVNVEWRIFHFWNRLKLQLNMCRGFDRLTMFAQHWIISSIMSMNFSLSFCLKHKLWTQLLLVSLSLIFNSYAGAYEAEKTEKTNKGRKIHFVI